MENILSDPAVTFDAGAPERVVSLTASVTGSLFDLGLGQVLVGVTEFCPVPESAKNAPQRVGGPKNPQIETILSLRPDLIIANQEENSREGVEALAQAGIPVWLTFPMSVKAAINDLWTLANLFRSDQAMQQVDFLERGVEWAVLAGSEGLKVRYFCPIWQDVTEAGEHWWMTFNDQSYSADLLGLFGGQNIFGERERRYPLAADLGKAAAEESGGRDTRYPRVTMDEILGTQPELILLPSEPYAYSETDCAVWMAQFKQTPAAQSGRIYAVDGSLIHWPGTRLVQALEELPMLFAV